MNQKQNKSSLKALMKKIWGRWTTIYLGVGFPTGAVMGIIMRNFLAGIGCSALAALLLGAAMDGAERKRREEEM